MKERIHPGLTVQAAGVMVWRQFSWHTSLWSNVPFIDFYKSLEKKKCLFCQLEILYINILLQK